MAHFEFQTLIRGMDVDTEDGGMAKVATLAPDTDGELFVRLQSWDRKKQHVDFHEFFGRRVKITIETID